MSNNNKLLLEFYNRVVVNSQVDNLEDIPLEALEFLSLLNTASLSYPFVVEGLRKNQTAAQISRKTKLPTHKIRTIGKAIGKYKK